MHNPKSLQRRSNATSLQLQGLSVHKSADYCYNLPTTLFPSLIISCRVYQKLAPLRN